ncbi:MAG: hypothetical protein WCS10_02175 [Bacteroidales bacterium]|jgi:hypothetical protein|nr:hypothetical protein [Bacteroidales bacterium]MDD4528650.1 hypothetical protein [Bacteroidales bacterium]
MKRSSLIIGILFLNFISYSQPTIPSLSKTKIQIGDQLVYSFMLPIENFSEQSIYIPNQIEDSLEIISSKIDTIEQKGKKYLNFTYRLTSFVVGKHQILNKNGRSFGFEVVPYPIDTTKIEIKDIKPNQQEPFKISEIMPIIIWFLLGIVLIIAFYFGVKIWKKYRKKSIKEIFIKPKQKLPAHVIAINSLDELRLKRLYENGKVKEYFSEISDILRVYLDNRYDIRALEMTTDEIFMEIKDRAIIKDEPFSLLEYILKYSDLVKFAKYIPDSFVSNKCIKDSIEFVNQTKLIENIEQIQGKEIKDV